MPMHDDYDRSSKWLIQHRGDSILRLAGVRGIRSWRPLQPELVQPKQLPDGLLEVELADQSEQDLYVVEIATYPEERLTEQVLRDIMLVYLDRRKLPEALTLVLCPRGNASVTGAWTASSRQAWARIQINWRVVEVWKLSAEELLAAGDVGLVPWAPLAQFAGSPEDLLTRCREEIERQAPPDQRANLLAVTQVMTRLRYNDARLLSLVGGKQVMIESPLIQELMAEERQKAIHTVLEARFGRLPADLAQNLEKVQDPQVLEKLTRQAATCGDLEAFRKQAGRQLPFRRRPKFWFNAFSVAG